MTEQHPHRCRTCDLRGPIPANSARVPCYGWGPAARDDGLAQWPLVHIDDAWCPKHPKLRDKFMPQCRATACMLSPCD